MKKKLYERSQRTNKSFDNVNRKCLQGNVVGKSGYDSPVVAFLICTQKKRSFEKKNEVANIKVFSGRKTETNVTHKIPEVYKKATYN